MGSLPDLLSHGYMPKQLPPSFNSVSWGDAVAKHSIAPAVKYPYCELIRHALYRPGSLPRFLGLPHPAQFHRLAELLTANWPHLISICSGSQLSLTTPRVGDRGKGERAYEPDIGFSGRYEKALERRHGRRVMLKADVAQCYPSIYTHAISWAIQGKSGAKAALKKSGGAKHYANILDTAVRDAQEKQSIGIPIGPDTSFVLANVLLSRVDVDLQNQVPDISGIRMIDDYEIYFDNTAEAEAARIALSHSLAKYNLLLNPRKTKVVDLPVALEPEWKHHLAGLPFVGNSAAVRRRIRAASDFAFSQCASEPDSRALTYFLGMVAGCKFPADVWPLVQSLALASVEFGENNISRICKLFLNAVAKGWHIDRLGLSLALNRVIEKHAPLRMGNPVIWAAWLMIQFDLTIMDAAVLAAANMEDAFVQVVLAHAKIAGIARSFNINNFAKSKLQAECWNKTHWLFLYECVQHGWLGSATMKSVLSGIKTDPYLAKLNKRDVQFYNPDAGKIVVGSSSTSAVEIEDAHAWGQIELPEDY